MPGCAYGHVEQAGFRAASQLRHIQRDGGRALVVDVGEGAEEIDDSLAVDGRMMDFRGNCVAAFW